MTKIALAAPVRTITVRPGLTLGYRELGAGPPVLLLHGWPTSSYLWRRVMPAIARQNRVLALDLPGFGASTKPVDGRYDFALFEATIDGFLAAVGVEDVAIAGHDLGGPIAMHWAITRQSRLRRLALLNTLIYPEFSTAVRDFVALLRTPAEADRLTSPDGLAEVMRLGVTDPATITNDVLAGVVAPFHDDDARRALAMAGHGLGIRGFAEIAAALPSLTTPVRVVYGERDNILPDVADTVARLARDLPNIDISSLPDCGHFLQEEAPQRVGDMLAQFFAST